ncbi:MAG: hypothetical protein AAF387_05160 [Pseudomonadota bacterium]
MKNKTSRNRPCASFTWVSLILTLSILAGCSSDPKPLKTWEYSSSGLFGAALSHDGNFAVVSSFSEGTSFWDLQKNERLYDWRHSDSENNISVAVFAANDSHVLTAEGSTFVIWSTAEGSSLGYWAAESDILDAALSNDAKFVLLALKDGRALHINRLTGRRLEVIAHRNERITSVAMSPDGRVVVTGGNDRRVMVWDAISGEELNVFEHSHRVVAVALDDKNDQVLSADENRRACVWSLDNGKCTTELELQRAEQRIVSARFSANGKEILLGFPGRHLGLWSTRSGKRQQKWLTPARKHGWVPQGSTVYAVGFAGQGREVIAQSSNGLGGKWKIL